MSTETFSYSTDDEQSFTGEYATREEALAAGIDESCAEPGATILTGKNGARPSASKYLPPLTTILDLALDNAHLDQGDRGSCWMDDIKLEQSAALQVAWDVFADAVQRTVPPDFWPVTSVESHVVPEADKA